MGKMRHWEIVPVIQFQSMLSLAPFTLTVIIIPEKLGLFSVQDFNNTDHASSETHIKGNETMGGHSPRP